MAKKKKNTALDILQLDMQQRDRELAAQLAMHNAEMAFKQKMMELVDVPALEEQKKQFAMQYALEQAKLDFEKDMAERTFGEDQRRWDIENDLNQRRFTLDQNMQEFTQKIQTGQLALDEATITGFFNGKPTLAKLQFDAETTGYDANGNPTFARQKFETETELRKAENVLNAPRGPADYAAYLNRLYGLQQRGMTPGVVNNLLTGLSTASAGAMQGAMPLSNTQFAQALMYGEQGGTQGGTQGGSQGAPQGDNQKGLPTNVPVGPNGEPLYTNTGVNGGAQQTAQQGTPQGTTQTPPQGTTQNGLFQTAAGGAQLNPTQQQLQSGGQTIKSGADVNYRDWQKLSPVTQEYVKGYAEENLGQPAEDFVWGIAQGTPTTQQGTQAKRGLFG